MILRKLALAASLLATSAYAQPTTPYRADSSADSKNDPNKIVCQKEERIGSRLGAKKICLTVAEWAARAREGRDQTEDVQSGTTVCGNPDVGCPTGTVWDGPPH